MTADRYSLAGAYALDALDPEERADYESFLATSPDAREEVETLREAAALLATAAVETPPEGLKLAVMDRIDTVRQAPPVVTSLSAARAARREPRPVTREWITNLSRGAAAIAAVIAVGMGVAVAQLGARLDGLEQANDRVAAVVAATDATTVGVALPDGGRISAVISPEQGSAIVVGDDLVPLAADQMYALWNIVDDVPVPVGELVSNRAIPVDAEQVGALGVTIEPRGPLSTPTSEPIGVLSV